MKSRTSFFNGAVLKKDITRFAPAWGLYMTAMLLLALLLFTEKEYHLARTLGTTLGLFSALNFCYALVVAALLFGDLFNSRLCNALHAMPLRREGWFLTHVTGGILFSVVPHLLVSLLLLPNLGQYWYVSFIWLGGMTLTYLFFFGGAVLAAMCTGSRFAMTLVYGLLNFLSILAMWIAQYLYEPLLYGIEINTAPFVFLSPVSYLCTNELEFLPVIEDQFSYYYHAAEGWPYVAGMAAVGIVMLIAALVLYRKRHLETAGDFITVRFLSPVFIILYTLAAGMALFLISKLFGADKDYVFLAVGVAVGFVTGKMLLKRTARVFKPATFVGMAALAAVLFGSLGLVRMDVFGLIRWMPEAEEVTSLSVRYTNDDYAYAADDAEEIRELMDIHQKFIQGRNIDAPVWNERIYLTYTLKDGSTVTRKYTMDYADPASHDMVYWFSRAEYVLQTDDVQALLDNVNYIEVESHYDKFYDDKAVEPLKLVQGSDARELLEAIIADCEAGTMIQDRQFFNYSDYTAYSDIVGYIRINVAGEDDIPLNIWEASVNTYNWMMENMAE